MIGSKLTITGRKNMNFGIILEEEENRSWKEVQK
jgi:hypothetical protein